ncbi:MAG: hypothetical protein A2070_12840 [Bdellovibrionales bacterium GWC1_52_8]|nr:MAG: hypothetical protein A2Z97_01605 [Bdellovibrionales bacterium GWB1_52_6]OFZ05093.1 MAG: hypothetical protein A2X97_00365 [Bdellovibrionales bacterium GWA1_52_35]OFZ43272.1 MAG: hypothetical protein A2070_12840 [Bdellovibrionales bacterium GWC1_52_8]
MPGSASVPKKWTVSELTGQIKGVLEPAFTQVWVQGEVSNYRPASSGHAYFSLKDSNATISAAFFGWGARRKAFELKDGLQVLCRGKLSVYAPRGNYQLSLDQIEPLGTGALQIAFELLKTKLAAEGLFASSRKRSLLNFPKKIAVVTSPSGAVIQDILNILKRRAPHIEILIVPASVQGEGAAAQVKNGIELINRHQLADVIVLARGGGSIEDLWAFNDESLARTIAGSTLPVISAVGHETDFTIADFVADLRAPTPSAAAELISGHWVDAAVRIEDYGARLQASMLRDLSTRKTLLGHITARLISPKDRLREQVQRCDELYHRLTRAMQLGVEKRKALLEHWMGKMDALSPLRVLQRGYAIVRGGGEVDTVIKSAAQVQSGQELRIIFHDGQKSVSAN